ncbi:endopeptidase La [Anaerolineae bacterium CFX9]|nr:endopeptidase La [Kamptonema cortianum]MDL1899370.1 endopeptidase La [Anaerolineae bacterium CFX9]
MTDSSGGNEFLIIPDAEPGADGIFERAVIPMTTNILFPYIVSPIALNTAQAISGAAHASDNAETVIALGVHSLGKLEFDAEDFFTMGTEVALGRSLRMPDGVQNVLAQGRRRVEVVEFIQTVPYIRARVRAVQEDDPEVESTAMMKMAVNLLKRVIDLNDLIPEDVLTFALNADRPGLLADVIATTLLLPLDEKQRLLEETNGDERLRSASNLLLHELNALELRDEIAGQIQTEMDRTQRELYLREQLQIIQKELGEEDAFQQELDEVREQIAKANLPEEVHDKASKELARLAMMTPMSPEVGMVRTYLDWLTGIPWNTQSEDRLDVKAAQKILDAQHYGLPKVKDRILEYIAVRKLAPDQRNSPILCFVGPPGVGKTSLGKSIAEALGRSFVRVSLGGVRDEAEIRGHRRTYIGALPGRIIQTMKRAGTINPVFMLDEIDKLGADFRGDPASALLEILDPEQNSAFFDHYLDVPYDLSKVLFITTANDIEPLPPALLDRLELIEFTGYTEEEKLAIARKFLIPRQAQLHGLQSQPLHFEEAALRMLIHEYTYEAGVRNLEREIANVTRKVVRMIAEGKRHPHSVTVKHITRLLGPAPFDEMRANDRDEVGLATGLAWTPFGGDILTIEVSIIPGKGNVMLTGSLGDIMQESAQTAMSYMRTRSEALNVPYEDFENFDVHVHLPEGATPKDGPSAGITLAVAIISAFTERKVRADFAMTGEITLRGKVLPVGGVKEKVLAARRARVRNIILPKQNQRDLVDVPKEALGDINIILVEDMREVIDQVLAEAPEAERLIDRMRRERKAKEEEDEE